MSKKDEGSEPPPKESAKIDGLEEPEDWDLPAAITEEDECPEILEVIEPEEAIETLFGNIHLSTIISLILGIIFGVFTYLTNTVIPSPSVLPVIFGFISGLLVVFGASELIILGVKGIKDKLNWNPYLAGILSSIGAALAELVIITILLIRSDVSGDTNLAIIAITLILTTVIINILFLGLSMIFVSRKEPFELPRELTVYEANLVLGMIVFSFLIFLYGLFTEFREEAANFSRGIEIVIGASQLLIYLIFLIILSRKYGKATSSPQTLITEFFPDPEDVELIEKVSDVVQTRLELSVQKSSKRGKEKDIEPCPQPNDENNAYKQNRHEALATLRRFPWFIIILLFTIGAGGVIWGGELLASAIENGLEVMVVDYALDVPILVYAVVVGTVSSSPELVVTMRGLLSPNKEIRKIGLVNQVSAINQTFFILFGFPFLLSGIIGIGIPIEFETIIVMGGIFIMSTAEKFMIMDDNHFDLLEGVVMTLLAIVSLLALALIGGFITGEASSHVAVQLVHIAKIA